MKLVLNALLAAGVVWTGLVAAQAAPDPSQAPAVASAYLEAVRAKGFAAEADFVHPDELARFQRMLLPVLEAEQAGGGRALLNATFGRDAALLDARVADPADFMRRFARVMAVRLPEQAVGFDELQVLGTVEEDPMVHVLVRLRTASDDASAEELRVVTLMPYEDTWKVALGGGLVAAVRAMDPGGQGKRPAPRLVPTLEVPPPQRPSPTAGDSAR